MKFVSALGTAATVTRSLVTIAKGAEVISAVAKQRKKRAQRPDWLPWLLLGVVGFVIVAIIVAKKRRRPGAPPIVEAAPTFSAEGSTGDSPNGPAAASPDGSTSDSPDEAAGTDEESSAESPQDSASG